jgi:hypothetical protein
LPALAGLARADGPPALEGYEDFEKLKARVAAIDASDFATVSSLCQTAGGKEVFLITVGTGAVDERPAILILGNVHAPHLAGSELAIRLAQRLADAAGSDEKTRQLLEATTFYVIPRPSPDAAEGFFQAPLMERTGNARPTDDDRDGRLDEDPPDDLNGDGLISMMRVSDPAGTWMPHPDEPRILVTADPKKNEQGLYRTLVEGKDDDGDGEFNEDGPGGVAFNKNFAFKYPAFEPGAGPNAVSEIETRAVADFAFDHPNIAAVLTFTPDDNLFHSWKPDGQAEGQRIKTAVLGADAPFVEFVAEQYRQIHGGKDPAGPMRGGGSFSDWAYFHFGRWSWAARAWWVPRVVPPEGQEPAKLTDERSAEEVHNLRWFDQQGIPAFVPWAAVDHPDFPGRTVEVGGFRPFVRLNPPAAELDPLADKHVAFLHKLIELAPRPGIDELKLESLSGGVYRLSAAVVNQGFLPTMSAMGSTSRAAYPMQAALDLPQELELVTGSRRGFLDRLAQRGAKVESSWLVRRLKAGPASATVRVYGSSVGSETRTVEVP